MCLLSGISQQQRTYSCVRAMDSESPSAERCDRPGYIGAAPDSKRPSAQVYVTIAGTIAIFQNEPAV